MITNNVSKQCRLASVLVIICFLVLKAAANEPDYYINQPPPGSNPGFIMDVAANDNRSDTSTLNLFEPASNGTAVPIDTPNGRRFLYLNEGFYGFATFRYWYGGFMLQPAPHGTASAAL